MKTDPRLKNLKWKDLVKLTPREVLIENTITLPWLGASWLLAFWGWWLPAVGCAFFFFLTSLRQSHNGFHMGLGLSPFLTRWSLHLNSVLMLSSMHAVKCNHLRHHKYLLGPDDFEGRSARMTWWGAILYGPIHIWHIHRITWLVGGRKLRWLMLLDLLGIAGFVVFAFVSGIGFLQFHVWAMVGGECCSAFFAVWTVHHDIGPDVIARTQRTGWKNRITYQMFYHLEHHLYPAVPTIHLPELAQRIDAVVPEMEKHATF
jgi:fatty acid desaturase